MQSAVGPLPRRGEYGVGLVRLPALPSAATAGYPINFGRVGCLELTSSTSDMGGAGLTPDPAAISAAAAILACASASGERRVPRRKGRSGVKTLVICALC